MIYCIESLGKATKNTESSDDEKPNEDKLTEYILAGLGVIPVVWAALMVAPFLSEGLAGIVEGFTSGMRNPVKVTWCADSLKAICIFLVIYGMSLGVYYSTRRNYRKGEEHGSAKWGNARQIRKKYAEKVSGQNLILTQNVRIGLDLASRKSGSCPRRCRPPMINAAEVKEEDEEYASVLDELFERLAMRDPEHLAVKQYHIFKLAAGKTAKSILISLGVRLEKFNLPQIAAVMNHDELDISSLGERKTAIFAIIPDSDSSLNFIIGMMYSSVFQELYYIADHVHGGRLPTHVHCVMDEFANVALPDEFDKLLATMRSREISVSIIIQNIAQLKALFEKQWESIIGNCDEFLYLGGNETGTHKLISESYLGKATIDTNTYGKSSGRSGNYSTNYQISGRELYTADEIRMLDNKYVLLFIRGEHPIQDEKFDILHHPNIKLTADGGMPPYMHGQAPKALELSDVLLFGDYADYEVLSEDEIYQLYQKESEEQENV